MDKRRRRLKWLILLLAVALVAGFLVWHYLERRQHASYEQGISVSAPTSAAAAQQTTSSSPATPIPPGCDPHPTSIVGTQLEFVRQKKTLPMISVGIDQHGAAGAPPKDEGYTIAWFNQGPAVGSDKGHVILTSHTFRNGGALGNDLNAGLLQTGDLIKISNGTRTICYRFTAPLKIWVKEYDPASDVLYNDTSAPEIAIVVCADYPSGGGEPLSRAVYFASLVTG